MSTPLDFDLRAALYFVYVVEEKSFTKAAMRIGISQPSMSELIRKLESQIGFPLFARAPRRFELTEKGRTFFEAAQRLSQVAYDVGMLARNLRDGVTQSLRIGASFHSINLPERSAIIERFGGRYPDIKLEVVHASRIELIQMLDNGSIDFALLHKPFNFQGLKCIRAHRSFGHFLVPEEDPLSSSPSIELSDLAGRSVVAPPRKVDPGVYDSYWGPLIASGAQLVEAPEDADVVMEQFARSRRLLHLRFGLGMGNRKAFGNMVRLPIQGVPILLELYLVSREHAFSPQMRTFWDLAESTIAEFSQRSNA